MARLEVGGGGASSIRLDLRDQRRLLLRSGEEARAGGCIPACCIRSPEQLLLSRRRRPQHRVRRPGACLTRRIVPAVDHADRRRVCEHDHAERDRDSQPA